MHLDTDPGELLGSPEIISGGSQSSGNIRSSGDAEGLDTADCLLGGPAQLNPNSFDTPPGDVEDLWLQDTIHLSDLKLVAEFMKALQGATLDDPSLGMSDKALHRLQNPLQSPVVIDEVTRLVIDIYMGTPSEEIYMTVCKAILRFLAIINLLPNLEFPSYYKVKCLVADLTGIESVMQHMCINSLLRVDLPLGRGSQLRLGPRNNGQERNGLPDPGSGPKDR